MSSIDKKPKITLVGAGPGDPDLISIKGIKALALAEVVLYDALVHPSLLDYAPDKAEKIFVGKRKGHHNLIQTQINELIVEKALSKGNIVRLKGGDPFIFGRGHEELVFAKQYDIEIVVIPGISSFASVPGLQGIPITKKGISESFMVTTATTYSGELSPNIKTAACSSSTTIIFMGFHKLKEIISEYKALNKHDTAIAIIENGSHETERSVVSTIDCIEEEVMFKGISSPALIIIGEVVRLKKDLSVKCLKEMGAIF